MPAFAESSPAVVTALLETGRPGGPMDARDDLEAGAAALITTPASSLDNPHADLPNGVAGTTFVGQFMDHDFIGCQTFFDFRDGQVKPRKRIDTTISTPLFNLR